VAQVVVPPRLIALLSSWGAASDPVAAGAADVVTRYSEPHRRYHTLEHIEEMLVVADGLAATNEVTCAVWLHDVIYDPTRLDNESRSAAFTKDLLESLGAPPGFVREVDRLIESTAHHDPDDVDVNGQVLADADLAILGAPSDRYQRYARDVRAEYAHVNDEEWRAGRTTVLETFLERPVLFHASQLRDALEQQAHENLRAEFVALTAP
jgi:predicted metal-dependent HD superfamily phosphohydrolase